MTKVATEIHFLDPTKEGLDWDTDPSVIEAGNSRYRLCCRSRRSGKIENIKGTVAKTFQLPPGTNKVVMRCTNTTEDYIVWGVYNSQGNDLILKYTIATDQIDIVMGAPNPLNFDPDYPVYNPKIIGDEIIYTDGLNEPRSFDLEKARLHMAGQGGYVTIDEQVIEAIKYPPLKAPEVEYISDSDVSTNNLRGKLWQFAYRWVYDDNAKSVLSPTSKVALPQGDELIDGSYFSDESVNNCIEVVLNTGHYIVERIEIFARDSNVSEWFLVDVLDKEELQLSSFFDYSYKYYNNTNRIKTDQNATSKLFDVLPERAMQQEVVNGEYLVYGNYLDGKDNINIDTQIQLWSSIIDYTNTKISLAGDVFLFPPFGMSYKLPASLSINKVLVVTFYIKDAVTGVFPTWFYDTTPPVDIYTARYVVKDGDTQTDIITGITDSINGIIDEEYGAITAGTPATATVIAQPLASPTPTIDYIIAVNFTRDSDSKPFYVTAISTTIYDVMEKHPSLKQGSYHQYGLVYSDVQGRIGNVQTSEDMKLYVPYWAEHSPGYYVGRMRRFQAAFFINHTPPVWADKCHIVYSKNQSQISSLQYLVQKTDLSLNAVVNLYEIKINQVITDVNSLFPNSIVGTYNWYKGDRLRIMYKIVNQAIDAYTVLPKLLDVEVLSQDPTTGDIQIPFVDLNEYGIGDNDTYYGLLIEIYSPRKEAIETERYWEIGETVDITNPGTAQRAHSPYNGIINSGDVYIVQRLGADLSYPCESLLYSDFYESNDFDYGRPNLVNKDAKQKWLRTYYRAGGRKILETKLNEFYRFDPQDFDSIGEMHGQITGMRQIGDTLKIYLENKCASQYIFRTSLVDVTGEESLQKSDKLFGTKRLSPFEYGCQDPGSIVVNDRYIYFLDAIRGVYCRDAANGIYPISSYKMVEFWRAKSELLRMNRGRYYVVSEYNKDYNELNVTIESKIDPELLVPYFDSFTILFMEEENRWKTFMPYIPDTYGRIGGKMVSFKEGELHLHDSNETRNNFYGQQYSMIIDVFGNIPPKQNKIFDAIAIHSNKAFEAPIKGDIFVYPCENYPDGMVSRLKAGKFEMLEGVYYASFLNDMSDPQYTNEVEALLNGRPLRGKVIKVILSNNDTSEVSLHFVTIKATISEHTD
jgi:hypothetical protein